MSDKSTPIKKEILSSAKTSNNQSTTTNIMNQETNIPPTNLINQNKNEQNKNIQNFTFKIIKRRAPWNKKEDEAIIELVNKYGTSNWTIIANEMANKFKSKHRNGKQCRERWHNHLDPIVNKNNWTAEEENILFNKHMEYGNKWSDISKFLPGRTDNSIKNHFYSKLRKFIRKILKQINKENLLKNNGIDYYKYNSDKVYKLLKKYKITYKNVTKETILDLIIATEKNQKEKIFTLNEDNKLINSNVNFGTNIKNNNLSNSSFNLNNNIINNSNEKSSRNNSANKLAKNIFTKKSKLKSKIKNNEENDRNDTLLKKDKKIFQSNIITNIKLINNTIENNNENILVNQRNNEQPNKSTEKYKKKLKKKQIISNDENDINGNNGISNERNNLSKNKLTINPDFVQETYKFKNKGKKIKNNNDKNLINKKRRRKKRRKVTISLSTPEKKKDRINRIMPKNRCVLGFWQKLPIKKKSLNKKNKLCPEDFDPTVNEVEFVREGIEIHSKSIIVINKSILTEKLFPDMNYQFKPNLNISIPTSPTVPMFPNTIQNSIKNGDENNNYMSNINFNEKNISIGLPTPMDRYYEGRISPVNNIIMFPLQSTKNIYKTDFNNENFFLRNNYTSKYMNGASMATLNTPKREINLQNKIVIQNNNNFYEREIINNIPEKSKKPAALNLEIIDNYNNDNISGYPTYPFFGGNENMGSSVAKQMVTSPANIFNLSPTSPFIPRHF